MKFYYFQDSINGYDSHLFSTKKAALDWIRHADKTYLEEGNDTFEEDDMQILYVSTHNKKKHAQSNEKCIHDCWHKVIYT